MAADVCEELGEDELDVVHFIIGFDGGLILTGEYNGVVMMTGLALEEKDL